ncbi:MAG: thiamine biosynthesis protein [Desulfuromonas sp.]|nr:MAG: thiamine biosynthesis protein [Desulfuromonas sp.]
MLWNRPRVLVLLGLIVALGWWQWHPQPGEVRRTRLLMGTTVEVVVLGTATDQAEAAIEAAFAEMTRLERLLGSGYAESDPAKLSRSQTEMVVAEETAQILELGLQVARESRGAFDLGLGRLNALWGLDGPDPRVPKPDQIKAALVGLGPEALDVDGVRVRRRQEVAIDLGAIAKGYIVDRGVQVLRDHGVTQAALNAGGDMFLLGHHRDRPWHIGIKHPRKTTEVLATLSLQNRAVVTSGDYERFFEEGGERYHHLFDPKTGYPARACQSVTVVAPSTALADALATAVFVLGVEQGFELIGRFPETAALIVASDGSQHGSPGLEQYRAGP